jgi:hypothetical protein
MDLRYKALIRRSSGPSGGSPIHLIGEGAPQTVCGQVESSGLTTAGGFDQDVCPACIEKLTDPSDGFDGAVDG